MPASVRLRPDFDAATLRLVTKRCPDSRQTRRLLALAAVYDGMSRAEAAKVANIGPNRFHQYPTVSWQMSMPRSNSKSST